VGDLASRAEFPLKPGVAIEGPADLRDRARGLHFTVWEGESLALSAPSAVGTENSVMSHRPIGTDMRRVSRMGVEFTVVRVMNARFGSRRSELFSLVFPGRLGQDALVQPCFCCIPGTINVPIAPNVDESV